MKFIVVLEFTDGGVTDDWMHQICEELLRLQGDSYQPLHLTESGFTVPVEVEAPNYSVALNAAYEVIQQIEMPQWPVSIAVTEAWYAKRGVI